MTHEEAHRDFDYPRLLGPFWQQVERQIESECVSCDKTPAQATTVLKAKLDGLLAFSHRSMQLQETHHHIYS